MFKYLLVFSLVFVGFVFVVSAQEDDPFADITYPIPELGNCVDKDDCLNYCDDPDNMEACLNFAEENNLIPEEDIEMGRKMLAAGETEGPGGCRGVEECGNYCDDMSNLKECLAFAEENNLIPPEELAEAKKVAAAIDRGVAPPPCNSKSECDNVCRQPENMKTCITFAKEAGLMSEKELAETEKVLAAIEKGVQPPACGGKDECDEYCGQEEHFEECITFAEAAGFMSADEAVMARKTGGKGPGDCRGKEECESFCEDPANGEACINFAIENGFMSAEEAEQAKKMLAAGVNMMQGGPGGCKGREECESFCDDENNMEECANFAVKAGMMSPEEAEMMKQMGGGMKQGGPGGCQGREECEAFCNDENNTQECLDFGQRSGMMRPEEAQRAGEMMQVMQRGGPGGCQGAQGCQDYCSDPSHLEECSNFAQDQGIISSDEAQIMKERGEFQQFQRPEGMDREEMIERIPEEFKEFMPQEGQMMPEGIMPEGVPPEMQQQFQQQYQQQFQEQMQQQMQQQFQQPPQQFSPPPSTEQPPQSFLDKTKEFLGGLIFSTGR